MKILKEWPKLDNDRNPSKYDYLFDGQIYQLSIKELGFKDLSNARSTLYSLGYRRGIKITIRKLSRKFSEDEFIFQALK